MVTTTITFLSSMLCTKLLYPNFSNLLLYALVLISLIFFFLFSTSSLLLGSSILQKWIHQSSFINLLMEGQNVKASSPSFSRLNIVVTIPQENVSHNLSLGLVTKARACKVASQKWSLGVTLHAPGSVRKCEGMNPLTLPRELPLWELESRWTSKFSKSNYRGQNSMDWGVFYIIEKTLWT